MKSNFKSQSQQSEPQLQFDKRTENFSQINDLVCPYCMKKNPSFSKFRMTYPNQKLIMEINCPCLQKSFPNGKSIDVTQYQSFVSNFSSAKENTCFKHKERNGNIFCKNCSLNMCNFCYSYHLDFEPSHEIDMKEQKNQNGCLVHQSFNLDFYCIECNKNICLECARKKHKKHKVIQLREYWEKVNQSLSFHSIEEVIDFVDKQINEYNGFVINEIDKINKIITCFQSLKTLFEKAHSNSMNTNSKISKMVFDIYNAFYQCRYSPDFQAIQNVERISLCNLLSNIETQYINKIFDAFRINFHFLQKAQGFIATKVIVANSKNLVYHQNVNEGMKEKENEKENESDIKLLQKKTKKSNSNNNTTNEETLNQQFKIPIKNKEQLNTNYTISNSEDAVKFNNNIIPNNKSNKIILPIHVPNENNNTNPIRLTTSANVKKEIFTFNAYICSKSNQNNNTSSNEVERISNNSLETIGQKEKNEIKTNEQQEDNKIKVNLDEGGKTENSTDPNEDDINFFNKVFGTTNNANNTLTFVNQTNHNETFIPEDFGMNFNEINDLKDMNFNELYSIGISEYSNDNPKDSIDNTTFFNLI